MTVTDTAGAEHDVTIKFAGYYDPGKLYGPPENCYPPEGEVEWEIVGLPAGVVLAKSEEEHIEESAFEQIMQYERDSDYLRDKLMDDALTDGRKP